MTQPRAVQRWMGSVPLGYVTDVACELAERAKPWRRRRALRIVVDRDGWLSYRDRQDLKRWLGRGYMKTRYGEAIEHLRDWVEDAPYTGAASAMTQPLDYTPQMSLTVVPMGLDEANEFIRQHHRHRGVVPGAKFAIAVACGETVVGVVTVGRPVARALDDGWTLEVTRCCTDGTPNAPSCLYAAAWRAVRTLGYRRLGTYTLKTEPGVSLRAAGWRVVGEVTARSWSCPLRPRVQNPKQEKWRWEPVA